MPTPRVQTGAPLDLANCESKLRDALKAYELAAEILFEAAASLAESETAAYSLAHPGQTIEFFGGQGLWELTADGKEVDAPFMDRFLKLEQETGAKGLGEAGILKYRNGKKVK